MKHNRRNFLTLAAGSLVAVTTTPARTQPISTPTQAEGPFYPEKLPLDSDNDLVRIKGRDTDALGIKSNVFGRVLDRDGQPLADAEVEIWQCNANGRYHHPDDTNDAPLDENFQAYGSTITNVEGSYRFRTIKPVSYPGRTPHIHFRITTPGGDQLTTQLYIDGHSGNQRDGLFQRLGSDARKQAASAKFDKNSDDSAELMARWDVVMG